MHLELKLTMQGEPMLREERDSLADNILAAPVCVVKSCKALLIERLGVESAKPSTIVPRHQHA